MISRDRQSRPLKAFVSSTYTDLSEHRAYVIDSLRRAGIFVDPMEEWTAAVGEPKKLSRERLDGCDLCVLLVAFRRGYVPAGDFLSITQQEHAEAKQNRIPVLVFVLRDGTPWRHEFYELDRDQELKRWRAELEQSTLVGYFSQSPDSIPLFPALFRWLSNRPLQLGADDSPGDILLGTWEHYAATSGSDFVYTARVVGTRLGDQYYLAIVHQTGNRLQAEPSRGLSDVESDGTSLRFKSDWGDGEIAQFALHRVSDTVFEGLSVIQGKVWQFDRLTRVDPAKPLPK